MSSFDCNKQEIRVGDVGTVLEVEVLENCTALDLSTATSREITLRRPDNTVVTRAANFTTDGTDGKIQFTVQTGDLTFEGTYYLQAKIILPTWSGYSSISQFDVYENLG